MTEPADPFIVYEVEDVLPEEDNGHYLSIDLGLHNLMTCYDNVGKLYYWKGISFFLFL